MFENLSDYEITRTDLQPDSMTVYTENRSTRWNLRSSGMGPIGYPETSVRNYHSTPRDIPGKELPLHAAWYSRRAQISSISQKKPKITQCLTRCLQNVFGDGIISRGLFIGSGHKQLLLVGHVKEQIMQQ
jgi:hypothetical protein